mgnify:CR=1 FL=1
MYVPPNIKTILDHFDRIRGGDKKLNWHSEARVGPSIAFYAMQTADSTLPFCYDFSFDKSHKGHIETILSIYPLNVGSVIYVLDDQFNHRYDVAHLLNLHNCFNLQYWIDVLGLMEYKHNVPRHS